MGSTNHQQKTSKQPKCLGKVTLQEIPTAEVYIIDAYCARAPMISMKKLASELNIYNSDTDKVPRLNERGLPTLPQIKDTLGGKVWYN